MKKRVLIIEDAPAIAKLQQCLVTQLGFESDLAENLHKARELCQQHEYYCAIVDYLLPDSSHGEAIRFTTENNIPTIVMTGELGEDTRKLVEQYPIVDYITKGNRNTFHYLEQQLTRLPRNEKTKVLLVDDSVSARHFIAELMKRQRFQVIEAANGQEAMEYLKTDQDINVIVTDFEMPVMDGVTLCHQIRQAFSLEDKVVIGISATSSPYLSARFLKSGANDYLHRPFNAEEFYCRLNMNLDMQQTMKQIRKQANTDFLTSLYNRRYFISHVDKLLKQKNGQQVALAMLDVDLFKRINDQYGHDVGDQVLKSLSTQIQSWFSNEQVARLGGEEFAIFFADTAEEAADSLREFCRFVYENSHQWSTEGITFSISVGLSVMEQAVLSDMLKQADLALYQAKSAGRNRLCIA